MHLTSQSTTRSDVTDRSHHKRLDHIIPISKGDDGHKKKSHIVLKSINLCLNSESKIG